MQHYLYDDLYQSEEFHWWHRAKRRLVLMLIGRYTPRRHPRILDVGCGTGKNIEAWSRLGTTQGIDVSPRAIHYCKKRGLTRVQQAKAECTKLTGSSVDVVTLLDVLEHTDDMPVIAEMARIITRRGILIVSVPAYPWLWSTWDVVLHHRRRYTKEELHRKLSAQGFLPIYTSHVFSFLPIPAILIRFVKSRRPPKQYGSDFQLTSGAINRMLYALCMAEQFVMQIVPLPFGTSIVCVAQKI